jgi:hypothetical protein
MKAEVLDGGENAGGTMLFLAVNGEAFAGILRRNPYIADDITPAESVEVEKFFMDNVKLLHPMVDTVAIPRQKLTSLAHRWAT